MEHIREYVQKADLFGSYYKNNVYDHLKEITIEITKEFKQVFEQYAQEVGLATNNSVYSNIYLFEFTDRVKDPVSLVEKLKNKNMIFDLTDSFDITNISEPQKQLLNSYFYNIDDIIGIKILTSLNNDCKNVLKLIKDRMSSGINGIKLILDGDIPTTMSNGREIYKIKGSYKETYSFELQVKSKIDSTWGDLEHNLFYKDYDFNYIKNNNKEIWIGIGSLLEETENLMLAIRHSKTEFNNEYERFSFYQAISEGFDEFVQTTYSSKYVLEKNMDRIYGLYNYCYGEYSVDQILKVEQVVLPEQASGGNILSDNFEILKTNNFDIALLEAIHFNWIQLKRETIEDIIRIEKLIRGLLFQSINEVASLLRMTLLNEQYIDALLTIIKEHSFDLFKKNLLLDIRLLAQFVMLNTSIDEVCNISEEDEFSEFEDLDSDNLGEFINSLKFSLFKQFYIENINLNDDIDKKIFISKMVGVLSSPNYTDNKVKQEVVHDTIHQLNLILGGRYE